MSTENKTPTPRTEWPTTEQALWVISKLSERNPTLKLLSPEALLEAQITVWLGSCYANPLQAELLSAQEEIGRLREEILEQKLSWNDMNKYAQREAEELEKVEDGLRDIVMLTRPGYDPSDDEGASAESVIGDIKHDVALLKNEKVSLIEVLAQVQNLINGVHGETVEDRNCLDTAWQAIQKALSSPAGGQVVPWSEVQGICEKLVQLDEGSYLLPTVKAKLLIDKYSPKKDEVAE